MLQRVPEDHGLEALLLVRQIQEAAAAHIQLAPTRAQRSRRKCFMSDAELIEMGRRHVARVRPADEQPDTSGTSGTLLSQVADAITATCPSANVIVEPPLEDDANPEPPHNPETGEVMALVDPNAPEIATIRDIMRKLMPKTDETIKHLSALAGRTIRRIGDLTSEEAIEIAAYLTEEMNAATKAAAS